MVLILLFLLYLQLILPLQTALTVYIPPPINEFTIDLIKGQSLTIEREGRKTKQINDKLDTNSSNNQISSNQINHNFKSNNTNKFPQSKNILNYIKSKYILNQILLLSLSYPFFLKEFNK